MGDLLDAVRTCALLLRARANAERSQKHPIGVWWSSSMAPQIDPTCVVVGHHRDWDYASALPVVEAVFGPDAADNIEHLHSDCANEPGVDLGTFLTQARVLDHALLLAGGWTQEDEWIWWTHGNQVSKNLAARWYSVWDKSSLNACAAARMTTSELEAILAAGTLPDPDAVALMVALS